MEKILQNYDFLYTLTQCNQTQCKRLLKQANIDELNSILECIKLCKVNSEEKKTLKQKQKVVSAVEILKASKKLIKPIVAVALCKIIGLAFDYIQSLA